MSRTGLPPASSHTFPSTWKKSTKSSLKVHAGSNCAQSMVSEFWKLNSYGTGAAAEARPGAVARVAAATAAMVTWRIARRYASGRYGATPAARSGAAEIQILTLEALDGLVDWRALVIAAVRYIARSIGRHGRWRWPTRSGYR